MTEKIRNFRDLDVWNKGIEIVKDVYINKEYEQFLYIALGSCVELETHIEIASELKYIDNKKKKILLEKINHESRMLTKLIKKLG